MPKANAPKTHMLPHPRQAQQRKRCAMHFSHQYELDEEYLKQCLLSDHLRLNVRHGLIRSDEEGQELGSKGSFVFTFVLHLSGAGWCHISWITIIKHLSVCSS